MANVSKDELATANALKRQGTEVQAFDASDNLLTGFQIWTDVAPSIKEDPSLLFVKCLVQPGSTRQKLLCTQIDPPPAAGEENNTFEVPIANAWNTNAQIDPMTYGDIGMLPQTNIPCVLDYLRHRFMNNQIYSTADPLLVAVNPFKNLGNATDEVIRHYKEASDSLKLDPHVFRTARHALENVYDYKYSQTIIVSGESGAGKTEATKQMMRYFAYNSNGQSNGQIQTAIMAANPVLEAFGNAKTIRNNNSSRFGRFMQLDVSEEGGIRYGSVVAFLLEKSRIITQDPEERSYHIFYQLLKGATPEMKTKYKLKGLTDYKFLNPKCLDVPSIDDVADFKEVIASFKSMGLDDSHMETIFSILSGVLLLGNVEIGVTSVDGIDDAAMIVNKNVFKDACDMLFLDANQLETELTIKVTSAGANQIKGPRKVGDAEVLKTSVCKAVYERLFLWLIRNLNRSIEPESGFKNFIGMLDIFGFEVFKNNSLEQLFINITNEMLQTNFVEIVFKREAALYTSEGISIPELNYTSNTAIIEILCSKGKSILSLLEDQCLAPGGTDENLVSSCNNKLKDSSKYSPAKVGSKLNFTVVHTIGTIQYNAQSFVFKNKDVLTAELVECVNASPNEMIRSLFENVVVTRGKLAKGQLIGSQFMSQLEALMKLINSTDSHFIRCVKPNETKKPLEFNAVKILVQLHALSIIEALQLRKLGYSYRRPYESFLEQYKYVDLSITNDKSLDPKTASQRLLESVGVSKDQYALGKTMMFLTQKMAKELTVIQRQRLSIWEPITAILDAWISRQSAKQKLLSDVEDIVRLQAHLRRHIVHSRVTPSPDAMLRMQITS
ncbi:Myosin-A [Babesia sp. Xinjiang]|uniref:Myosin-A n=1 Tax=Babesia sp. Xinjiang TaxID=462227 RepID=UPI000A25E953|nr:Myosin-A [Babesia sp. Xinjiang]XP_028871609.1 Myosin-A [Babesia sp. Xinjiang]ORM41105.1 Myosin-A [Babesia sp. Xinjiang]ORM41153.1 Myosin-A [Babesia sp. Xinjiang]